MDKRKKYFIVLDIETANIVEEAIAYDIGFIVADKKGNIYEEYSYMVSEMFFDNKDLLDTAYYKEKLPKYWEDYKNGKRQIASILTVRKQLRDIIDKYNIKEIYAYNGYFDKTGCNRTLRYLTKSKLRWFFPYGVKFYCIWNIACQTIFQQKTYAKIALMNNWITKGGRLQSSAEVAKRYISGDIDFQEEHTGLEDTKIELEILVKCLKQHKKIDKNINRLCWRQLPKTI